MMTRLDFMIHELNVSEKDTELETAQNKARMSHVKLQHVSRKFSYVLSACIALETCIDDKIL